MSEQCLPFNVTQCRVHHSYHPFFVKLLPSSTWTSARPSRRGRATFGTQTSSKWIDSEEHPSTTASALCPSASSALILGHSCSFSLHRGHPRPHGGSSTSLIRVIPFLPSVNPPLSCPHAQMPPFEKLLW